MWVTDEGEYAGAVWSDMDAGIEDIENPEPSDGEVWEADL